MRIGVTSDSHGSEIKLRAAADVLRDADIVVHLGDMARDAGKLAAMLGREVVSVAGNCDVLPDAPFERTERWGGTEVFLCHGHTLRVKQNLLPLRLRAQECGAAIALFGHTHVPTEEYQGGVLLVNPGALKDGWLAIVDTESMKVEHIRL